MLLQEVKSMPSWFGTRRSHQILTPDTITPSQSAQWTVQNGELTIVTPRRVTRRQFEKMIIWYGRSSGTDGPSSIPITTSLNRDFCLVHAEPALSIFFDRSGTMKASPLPSIVP